MPELEQVETPKNAGFIQRESKRSANKRRIEEDEAELKALMEARNNGQEVESSSQGSTTAEVQDAGNTQQKEANAEGEAQKEDNLSSEEKTYKKRYSDLRNHLNKQSEEIKELKELLQNAQSKGDFRGPASDESIDAWAKKYPQIASIVETIADKKAAEKFAQADQRLAEIDKMTADAHRTKAENEIRAIHSDFDDLRSSDAFHDWAGEQPKWVQDALYENQDDPRSVIRVIDLYKVDNGMDAKGAKRNTRDAASAVATKRTTRVDAEDTSGTFRESQVQKMSTQEYEAKSDAIMEAIRSGKFIYDISGGAR